MVTRAADTSLPAFTRHDGVLSWDVPPGWWAISSASVGGGLLQPRWVLNAGVGDGFARTDLAAWAEEVATTLGLDGPGCALLTAADVSQVQHAQHHGVTVWATVGVTKPTWPHDPRARSWRGAPEPGTVNIVVALTAPLTASALVQAVGTVTEAKAQVLVRSGVPGTGTASDAVVVLCPGEDGRPGAEMPFAGVRSAWGMRIAQAVHDAVGGGLTTHPWTGTAAGDDRGQAQVW